MNNQGLSLGDFVKQLALLMSENKLDMPFKEETPWHFLFYRLKKDKTAVGRPSFFNTLRFDWDAAYPKCQELSDFIQALHWTGTVIAVNPTYEKIILQEKVGELWSAKAKKFDKETVGFLQHALKLAREEFPGKSNAQNISRADA